MEKLSDNHWVLEGYRQRMTNKDWRQLLLNKQDSIFINGELRQLMAKNLGSGIVEVYKRKMEK